MPLIAAGPRRQPGIRPRITGRHLRAGPRPAIRRAGYRPQRRDPDPRAAGDRRRPSARHQPHNQPMA